MNTESNIYFKETQQFRQPWIWFLVLFTSGMTWYSAYRQFIVKKPFGNNPAPDWIMGIVLVLVGIGLPILIYICRLETEVRPNKLCVRLFPFQITFIKYPYSVIKNYHIRTYSALKEYGGYGLKFGKNGRAFNITGNKGMQIELRSGNKILIGTQKENQFFSALDSLFRSYQQKR